MLDWQTLVAIGALALSAFVVFSRAVEKSLTIREHEEFKASTERWMSIRDGVISEAKRHIEDRVIIREFSEWCEQFRRDIERLDRAVAMVDQTKPTTGELQMAVKAVEARLVVIEDRIKLLNAREMARVNHRD